MVGITEEMHVQLKKMANATGMLQYRLMQEALNILEENYKEKILKYEEKNNE